MSISMKICPDRRASFFSRHVFCHHQRQDFLDQEQWGQAMLLASLGAAFLVFPAVAVKWERAGCAAF